MNKAEIDRIKKVIGSRIGAQALLTRKASRNKIETIPVIIDTANTHNFTVRIDEDRFRELRGASPTTKRVMNHQYLELLNNNIGLELNEGNQD